MYRFDDVLGYSPTPNFKGVINEPLKRWENVQVTILEDSNRLSFQESFKQNYLKNKPFKFITVGNSFTFGDQVSNSETWQSCLNNKESQHFYINSGVGGYGILQPIMRAKSLLNIYKEDSDTYGIILSVLVGHTARDMLDFRSSFQTQLIKADKEIIIKSIPVDSKSAIGGNILESKPIHFYL